MKDWPLQKAHCRDYERLRDSLGDLATIARTIPSPVDGEDVTFDTMPSVVPGEAPEDATPTGLYWAGYAANIPGEGQVYVVPFEPSSPYETVALVFYRFKENDSDFVKLEGEIPDSRVNLDWSALVDAVNAEREKLAELIAWAVTIPTGEDSVDNSDTRAAIVELIARLVALETAFAETLKKWPQH